MNLQDPVAVYDAADTFEVHYLRNLLSEAGIPAFAEEDVSATGTGAAGLVREPHHLQVFVERTDAERAVPLLEAYERQLAERAHADEAAGAQAPVRVACKECGKVAEFPVVQLGTVQVCPACGAFVDVALDEQRIQTGE